MIRWRSSKRSWRRIDHKADPRADLRVVDPVDLQVVDKADLVADKVAGRAVGRAALADLHRVVLVGLQAADRVETQRKWTRRERCVQLS